MLDSGRQKCRICGSNTTVYKTGRVINDYSLSRCACCHTVLIEKKPEVDELTAIYNNLFEKGGYNQHRIEFEIIKSGKMPPNFYRRHLLKRVERMCSGRRLIEIGGGTGGFGVLSTRRGWEYTNYDISEVAVVFCKELSLKANFFSLGSLPSLSPESADLVVMWEVIEHIWNLCEYLELVRETLKTDGIFLFSTPNYLLPYYQKLDHWGPLAAPPVHLNFFTKESLEACLRLCGFKVQKVFKRRIYKPNWSLNGLTKSLRTAVCLEEPPTLYGMAGKELEF